MAKFNLSEAAKEILNMNEDSKSTFDSNIAAKRAMRGGDTNKGGAVGTSRLDASVAYGEKDSGFVGRSPEKTVDPLPDYLKNTPRAIPPGATPPVGAEKDGVGATRPRNQPQEKMGRNDIMHPVKKDATPYEDIRDGKPAAVFPNTFTKNKNAVFTNLTGLEPTGNQKVGNNEDVEYDDDEETIEEAESAAHERRERMQKNAESAAHERKERMKERMKEDIDALLSGENLSEEFVSKATTIFEAAVIARAEEIVSSVEEELAEQFEAAVEEVKEELAAKVDDYMNYMAEEWMQENKLAVAKGLRAEIVEDFIGGLRDLFIEHYIDIPEDKVDVVEELTGRVEELEEEINDTINFAVQMKKELNEHKKFEAIYTACEGLTQTQVEKMKSLAEGVDFTTEEEFADKLETLKESYFSYSVRTADRLALDEEVMIEEETKKVRVSEDPMINQYAKAISQTQKQ